MKIITLLRSALIQLQDIDTDILGKEQAMEYNRQQAIETLKEAMTLCT